VLVTRADQVETLILGAGLTGLSTALHLSSAPGHGWLLLEKEDRVGGLTRTEEKDGFFFDHTGHWLHLRHAHTQQLVRDLLGADLLEVERLSRVWSFGRYTPYPFQANLFGLPPEVVKECLLGVIEAKTRAAVETASGQPVAEPRNFLEYIERHFGAGIAKHFMIPYNTKLWGVAPTEISAAWCSRFVPKPSLEQVVEGAVGEPQRMGYNVRFVYPREGGIETLVRRLAARLRGGEVATRTRPVRIDWRARRADLSDGRSVRYEHLVSSIPLPDLLATLHEPPAEVAAAAARLRCTSLRYINLGLAADRPFDGTHWIYLPEDRYPFYRVGCASNAVASLAPPGHASCYVELSNAHAVSDVEALAALKGFLREVGAITREEQVVVADVRTIRHGYVIFDDHYFPAKALLMPFLAGAGIRSVGRYGAWVYSSMEDAIVDGMESAAAVLSAGPAEGAARRDQ
jgi:protoporphyrinogen oxidase